MSKKTNELQPILEKELQRLAEKLELNLELKVVWKPDKTASLSARLRTAPYTFTKQTGKKQFKPSNTK